MDEGLRTIGKPYYLDVIESEVVVCDECGSTKDDYGLLYNPKLSVNKPHRSLSVNALGCNGILRLRKADSMVQPKSTSSFHFQHFSNAEAVCDYLLRELQDSLRDDLDKMKNSEAEHYTDEDRAEMQRRITDIQLIAPFIRVVI